MKSALLVSLFTMAISLNTAGAQTPRLMTMSELNKRMETGKDTTYVLNFWATWCAPCIKEMPHFEKLQTTYAANPVKVIFLSLDFKSKLESNVKPLVKRLGLKNEVYLVDKKSEQEFIDQINKDWEGAIPATVFVNKSKGLWQFYQKEFSYEELEKTYQSLK
ncbi:TlpA disulfide reductase family protein [Pedobacter sp. SYSU D00535]|uniref:TlpA disulfide reductase family protein n=1 Tax=Pedobacter sp. SYSU D00535 TaxID=2810308 RepID=UPI001A973FDE|nr:TlpA disulfide reductase family protein [Pedobacter sp. SYSU D00535]